MIHFTSPAGWLPVHRDQLRAQRSVTSMGKLYILPLVRILLRYVYERPVYTMTTVEIGRLFSLLCFKRVQRVWGWIYRSRSLCVCVLCLGKNQDESSVSGLAIGSCHLSMQLQPRILKRRWTFFVFSRYTATFYRLGGQKQNCLRRTEISSGFSGPKIIDNGLFLI